MDTPYTPQIARCPFCGREPHGLRAFDTEMGRPLYGCTNPLCFMNDVRPVTIEQWNNRPDISGAPYWKKATK